MGQVMIVAIAVTDTRVIDVGIYFVLTIQAFFPGYWLELSSWVKFLE
jgi:hypothetical protein